MNYSESQQDTSLPLYPKSRSYQEMHQDNSSNGLNNLLSNQVYMQQIPGMINPINQQYQPYPYSYNYNYNYATSTVGEHWRQINPWTLYQYYYPLPPNNFAPEHLDCSPSSASDSTATTQVVISTDDQQCISPAKIQETTLVAVKVEQEKEKEVKKPPVIMVGRRRGGRILPTGVVKKRTEVKSNTGNVGDSYLAYKAEVRRYTERLCEDDKTTRPLVK